MSSVGMKGQRGGNYIIHELLADRTDLLGECGAEHHALLFMGSGFEYLLNISTHVWREREREREIMTLAE